MVANTPLVVKVACRSLTAHHSPSNANHCHESHRCPGALWATSPSAHLGPQLRYGRVSKGSGYSHPTGGQNLAFPCPHAPSAVQLCFRHLADRRGQASPRERLPHCWGSCGVLPLLAGVTYSLVGPGFLPFQNLHVFSAQFEFVLEMPPSKVSLVSKLPSTPPIVDITDLEDHDSEA